MRSLLLLAIAGASGVAHAMAFAPWNLPWLQALALATLFALSVQAHSVRRAASFGFFFGAGWFGVGVWWVYVSMHVYGGMPALLAALATAAFVAFLALYPALALALAQRLVPHPVLRLAIGLPAFWTLTEWLRSTVFTGFPWLATGYAHTDSPLAGFAPLLGVHGVTLAAALLAGALALLTLPRPLRGRLGYAIVAAAMIVTLAGGALLGQLQWTSPYGQPISVRLVQANMPQQTKFSPEGVQRAFDGHWPLMQGPRADLVALPESVFPEPLQRVPAIYLESFQHFVQMQQSGLIFGVFIAEPGDRYFNSAVGLAPNDRQLRRYSKRHLVPFGEFIPFGFRWFVDLMHMPIGDQQRGAPLQPPMEIAGQRVAVNICYEDLFGEVIAAAWQTGSAPTMMLNLSNLAWFEDTIALPQHLQISRMRVLETQHPMLRATNTGATAIIDERGRVTAQLPFLTAGALTGQVQGFEGLTPFLRFGNVPALILMIALALIAVLLARRRA